jgi:hypothetical protein
MSPTEVFSHLITQPRGVEPPWEPKRPRQGPPTFGEIKTADGQVQVRTSPLARSVDVEPSERTLITRRSVHLTRAYHYSHQV